MQPEATRRRRVIRLLARIAWLIVIGASSGIVRSPASAAPAEQLGEVNLVLRQTDAGGIEPSNKPRLAVLLIDCSESMTWGIKKVNNQNQTARPGNPPRWEDMKTGLRSTLEQLLDASKGIEVQIRFFSNALDQFPGITTTLDGPASIAKIMKELEEKVHPTGKTVLYDATTKVAREISRAHKTKQYEWILFGIFSDGQDDKSREFDENDRNKAIDTLKSEAQFENLVFTVGPEANGDYGDAIKQPIGGRIPLPRERPPSYVLELAPGQAAYIEAKKPATAGATYELGVSLADDKKALANGGMKVTAKLSGTSALLLKSQELVMDGVATATLKLDVRAGADVGKGVSAVIDFAPEPDDKRPFLCSGTAQVRLAFAADETLPNTQWHIRIPAAVKRGDPTSLWIDPGKASRFTWKFKSPGGRVEPPYVAELKQFERKFDEAGTWGVEYSCVSQSGKTIPTANPLPSIEVVDADFRLEPREVTVDREQATTVAIVPNPEARTRASYKAVLDEQQLVVSGTTVAIPGTMLAEAGRHYLSVTATVVAGGNTFSFGPHTATIKVKPGVRIVRVKRGDAKLKPDDPQTTTESIPPGSESAFQLMDVDLTRVDSIEWTYELPHAGEQTQRGPEDLIRLVPQACGTLKIRAVASMKNGQSLVSREEHFDVGGIPPSATPKLSKNVVTIGTKSVELNPGLKGTFKTARVWFVPRGAAADAQPEWEQTFDQDPGTLHIDLPKSRLGEGRHEYEFHVSMKGYPGCMQEDWTLGAPLVLKLVPRPKYELWLLSVLALLGLGWLLFKWLWGNDPLRWWIDFSFTDPGPPTAEDPGNYRLDVGEPTPASAGRRTSYRGWSRKRKEAFVPLWLFAERADSDDGSWLNDPRWADLTVKIVNAWKNPFELGGLGVSWKSERRYAHLESAEPISLTLWLQPPWDGAGTPPAMWMRMRCPRGGDPWLWIFWTYVAGSVAAAIALLPYFGLISL